MIPQTGDSQWFGGPIIILSENTRNEVLVEFPDQYQLYLHQMEAMFRSQLKTKGAKGTTN